MPVWTESQKRDIETQNRSLLVSAGAGSGKTTVLTERIRYSDIAVLFRTVRGFSEPYENALERCGVPVRTERADEFLARPEIELALSLLKAVDNPADDIAVAAVKR